MTAMEQSGYFLLALLTFGLFGLSSARANEDLTVSSLVPPSSEQLALSVPTVYVYEFSAKWCPSCRTLKPIIEKTALRHSGFIRFIPIDMDNPETANLVAESQVRAIPAVILKDRYGRTLKALIGLQEGLMLDRILDNYKKQALASSSQIQ